MFEAVPLKNTPRRSSRLNLSDLSPRHPTPQTGSGTSSMARGTPAVRWAIHSFAAGAALIVVASSVFGARGLVSSEFWRKHSQTIWTVFKERSK
jgi:hypothetical protein